MTLNIVRLAAAALLSVGIVSSAAAEWMPTKPIRVIIPYAAGGTGDTIARTMSDHVSARLGQPLLVDNRGGGATQIGTSAVAKAEPDGQTILLVANTFLINPGLFKSLPYDSVRDFAPITYAGVTPHVVVINNDVPAKTLKEFLDLARSKPGQISYASAGTGSSFHLGTEELKKLSGVDMVHVPYKGPQFLTDLIAGSIQMAFANATSAVPLVKTGKIRALAVAYPARIKELPDVPTVAEQGYPGFESNSGFLFIAHGRTPPEVLDRLNGVFVEVLNLPEVREAMTKFGVEVMATSRSQTADFMTKEMKRYADIIAFSGAKAE